jgi:hypothetical protein
VTLYIRKSEFSFGLALIRAPEGSVVALENMLVCLKKVRVLFMWDTRFELLMEDTNEEIFRCGMW